MSVSTMRLWFLMFAAAIGAAGCASSTIQTAIGPKFDPTNIYLGVPRIPPQVRRVAVLPLTARTHELTLETGREALQPVLLAELAKTKTFELVVVHGEELRVWTGKAAWSAEETLPHDFFKRLQTATGCDALLFCQLTAYRPYSPLAIGWSWKLVQPAKDQPLVLWAADEVFDAGQPAVVNSARAYGAAQQQEAERPADDWLVLNSPRRFAQYTAQALLAKLPPR